MTLTEAEARDLRCVAGMMIPPGAEYGVPGADDPAIFADMVATMGRDTAEVRQALACLSALAGGPFADLDPTQRDAAAERFRARGGTAAATLSRVILASYYRDARVIRSLGLEPGPPFPKGRVVEQGDWSLLDPVRARPPMWREV